MDSNKNRFDLNIDVQANAEGQGERAANSLDRQFLYEKALSQCSRALLQVADSQGSQQQVLNQALEHLYIGAQASRAYLFRNFQDPEAGLCLGIYAEACAPEIMPHIQNPANRKFPWSQMPLEMRNLLEVGKPVGGIVEHVFAGMPSLIDMLQHQENPLLSVLFFPIQIEGCWWGFVGFDDCVRSREWDEREILLLGTAAELLGNTLHRWETETLLRRQVGYQNTILRFSQILSTPVDDVADSQDIINEALQILLQAVQVSRVRLFRNLDHPELGFSHQYIAEACAPGIAPRMAEFGEIIFPWSIMPTKFRQDMEARRSVGGLMQEIFAAAPEILANNDTISAQFFPIHSGDYWWGAIAFGDCETPRQWDDLEITLLHTAGDIIGNSVQRWQAQEKLVETLDQMEQRVLFRTRELSATNEQLRKEVDKRLRFQRDLEKRLKIESLLARISGLLVQPAELQTTIKVTLQYLGEIMQANRVTLVLFELGDNRETSEVHDWHSSQNLPIDMEQVQYLRHSLSWFMSQLQERQTLYIEDLSQLPLEAKAELDILTERGVKSLILLPLFVEDNLVGVLVCSNFLPGASKLSENLRAFEVVGSMLSNLLQRENLLRTLEKRVMERTHELSAFFEMAMLSSESQDMPDILHPALSRIMEISNSEAACIHLFSHENQTLKLVAQRGIPGQYVAQMQHIPIKQSFRTWFNRPEPDYYLEEKFPAGIPDELCFPGYGSFYLTKLRAAGNSLGTISCYRISEQPYTPFQASMLIAVGEQLGVMVENHRLALEAEKLATIQERQRLARELHDAVSQSLYSLTLFARSGRDALEAGDRDKLEDSLEQLEVNSLTVLREMRLLLYQLRSLALEEGSLKQAIQARFEMVEHRLGIRTNTNIDESIEIPGGVEQELFRLVIEALNNALKHAMASEVSVTIHAEDGQLALVVWDNGRGFDLSQARGGMGLQNMHERAVALGGQFEIYTQMGDGTQIRLAIPISQILVEKG